MDAESLRKLRTVITENLRVQRGGAEPIPYIDVANVLVDVSARQNHAIFGRRGCGKTLLLHHSAANLPQNIKPIYINCEDFKKHSFPNVLIEILDALFEELENHLSGWFGKKRKSKELIGDIRKQLAALREQEDEQQKFVNERQSTEKKEGVKAGAGFTVGNATVGMTGDMFDSVQTEMQRVYTKHENKIRELDMWLPHLKRQIREFFSVSSNAKTIFLQIDDFYHLSRSDQPLVIDYIHRLCKDLPLYFKIATLRHVSALFAERSGQPIGAQERHDYQPINIDFTFAEFQQTVAQNEKILFELGRLADISPEDIRGLFKGAGFSRLVQAGGGVPRDCLSLFIDVLDRVQPPHSDGRVGKDDVRTFSRANFERRIEELKQDSEGPDQRTLIQGIYVLRQFCVIDKTMNAVLVPEAVLQQNAKVKALLYRLLDYRIIHSSGTALTHKSQPGTYHAFVIDIGCYAHMRVLDGRFIEIDLNDPSAREKMRSAPILDENTFMSLWDTAPHDLEQALVNQEKPQTWKRT